MWTGKKREVPREPEPKTPAAPAPPIQPKPAQEAKPMTPSEPPRSTPAAERGGARVGAGLRVQGEISGNEDLQIDGTVDGHVHLGERRLTIGATARVTAAVSIYSLGDFSAKSSDILIGVARKDILLVFIALTPESRHSRLERIFFAAIDA